MYVVTPRSAAAAVVSAVVLRRPTTEYTHPYSMMHRRLPTAGIEVAPHYHQLLVGTDYYQIILYTRIQPSVFFFAVSCLIFRRMSGQSGVWRIGNTNMGNEVAGGWFQSGSSRGIPGTWFWNYSGVTAAVLLHVYLGQAYVVTEAAASAQRWKQQQQQQQVLIVYWRGSTAGA